MTDITPADAVLGADTSFGSYVRQFLGRRVRVTLDHKQGAAVEGVLIHATDDGSVTVRDEEGVNHYAWPNLRIDVLEAVDEQRCSHDIGPHDAFHAERCTDRGESQ